MIRLHHLNKLARFFMNDMALLDQLFVVVRIQYLNQAGFLLDLIKCPFDMLFN